MKYRRLAALAFVIVALIILTSCQVCHDEVDAEVRREAFKTCMSLAAQVNQDYTNTTAVIERCNQVSYRQSLTTVCNDGKVQTQQCDNNKSAYGSYKNEF